MIPEVIVIILLTTTVVTSMELHLVSQCPNDEEWSERAHKICENNEYRYHCMFSVQCTLVESCIEPQLGSYWYSETEYGVYFLDLNNETGSPEFYKMQFDQRISLNLITNSSDYWKYLYFAYCKEHTKDMFVLSRTETQAKISCEDSPGNYNVVLLVMVIIGWVLAVCIAVVCVIVCILFYKYRKRYPKIRKTTGESSVKKKDGHKSQNTSLL